MFARVQVPGSPPYQALLVPDVAIASEQARRYVLVVDGENVVRQKYVMPGQVVEGLRVIREGLAAEDRVVVSGQMQARPGQKATVQEQQRPTPGAPAAAARGAAPTRAN
jgi:hypothetical protein